MTPNLIIVPPHLYWTGWLLLCSASEGWTYRESCNAREYVNGRRKRRLPVTAADVRRAAGR